MQYLAIKKFAELQHYKDRHPPWIRLYNRLLDDYAFLQLSEVAQRHLICLWLLASRHDNRIPFDLTYICRAIQAKSAVDIDELIGAGFVEKTEEVAQVKDNRKNGKLTGGKRLKPRASRKRAASKPLADCKQNAVPETETEERQREKQAPASGEAVNPFAFMGRINAIHREFYGGEPPKGTATALAPLAAALGVDDLEARFRAYCQKTEATYLSIPKFARTWKAYSPTSDTNTAAKLWAEMQRTGILLDSTTADWQRHIGEIVATGAVKSREDFETLWRKINPNVLRGSKSERQAVDHIAAALVAA